MDGSFDPGRQEAGGAEQLELPGIDPRPGLIDLGSFPQGSERLFVGIFLDKEAAARATQCAGELRTRLGLTGMAQTEARMHVTLLPLGDYAEAPSDIVAAASRAASGVKASSFAVAFDTVRNFPSGTGIYLGGGTELKGLRRFRSMLVAEMKKVFGNSGPMLKPFSPHVTLFYNGSPMSEQKIEPIRWTVREFALVHSELGRKKHNFLERWSLAP